MDVQTAYEVARKATKVENPRIGEPGPSDPHGWSPVIADSVGGVRRIGWIRRTGDSVAWTVDFPEYDTPASEEAAMADMITARHAHALGIRLLHRVEKESS